MSVSCRRLNTADKCSPGGTTDGNAQYFWAGNNTDGIHTCQCGIDGDCVNNSFKCNCDAAAPIPLVDDGKIFNFLPLLG